MGNLRVPHPLPLEGDAMWNVKPRPANQGTGRPVSMEGVPLDGSDENARLIPRTTDHDRGRPVVDSPRYVERALCPAVRRDGIVCNNELKNPAEKAAGFCLGHSRKDRH